MLTRQTTIRSTHREVPGLDTPYHLTLLKGTTASMKLYKTRPMADDAAGSTYARLDARTMETRTLQELYVPVINSEEKQKDDIRVYEEFIPQLENSDNEDDEEPGNINHLC